jgi:copper transport protein
VLPGKSRYRRRWTAALFALLCLIAMIAALTGSASAHAELARSDPAQGAALGSAPSRVDLWFTEDLTPTGSTIRVYDAQRRQVDKGDVRLDPNDAEHLSISLDALSDGTYTVAWTSASSTDGHVLSGTFTFSVGVSRLPGAAASTNQSPSPGAVALRWIVFLGLMIAGGWFLLRLLGVSLAATRREIIFGGALAALLGDLLLLPVQAFWPGGGLPTQSLANAYSTMPPAWFARLGFEVVILGLTLAVFVLHRKGNWIQFAGVTATGAAIVALALTTHAAARSSYHLPVLLVEIVHVESVAFWLGGLALLALLPKALRADYQAALRRFSRLAVILAPLAIASGILNAGITLPTISSLWESSYGKILLVKVAFVIGIGIFAWLNRRVVRSGIVLATRFVRSLRIEVTFGVAAILAASVLSLWAPPQAAKIVPLQLSATAGDNQTAHFDITPVRDGSNQVDVWLTDAQGQPVTGINSVVAGFSMLERPIDLPDQILKPDAGNHWSAQVVPLTVKGWWRLNLIFFKGAATPADAQFYFMIPDPTLAGGLDHRSTDVAAQSVFQSAISTMDTMTSMRNDQTLADGVGNSVESQFQYAAPDRFAYQTSSHASAIAVGLNQWYRLGDGAWDLSQRTEIFAVPHTLTTFYSGATEFTLGRTETIDGEVCQIITFSVPEQPGQGAAWYSWWVGTNTHLLRREAMVADHHYMLNHNYDFNNPITIAPPTGAKP